MFFTFDRTGIMRCTPAQCSSGSLIVRCKPRLLFEGPLLPRPAAKLRPQREGQSVRGVITNDGVQEVIAFRASWAVVALARRGIRLRPYGLEVSGLASFEFLIAGNHGWVAVRVCPHAVVRVEIIDLKSQRVLVKIDHTVMVGGVFDRHVERRLVATGVIGLITVRGDLQTV